VVALVLSDSVCARNQSPKYIDYDVEDNETENGRNCFGVVPHHGIEHVFVVSYLVLYI
jgi:hypothetical protein